MRDKGLTDAKGTLHELAERQHGVVSVRQLTTRLGYSRSAIGREVKAGRLHPVHRGVYAVGHRLLSPHGECLAAVLACGPGTLLSHYSAAWLWGLSRTSPAPFHVTTPMPRKLRPPIRVHCSRTLVAADRALVEMIPVTSLARTLLDQAAAVDRRRLDRLLERSEELELFDLPDVDDIVARNSRHRGAKPLRLAVDSYRPPKFTRSEAERLLLAHIERAGLPAPATGFNLQGHEVDFHWPDLDLVVELDFFETHGTRAAFARDRERREDLLLADYTVSVVTGERLEREPERAIARVTQLIEMRQSFVPHTGTKD